MMMMYQLVPCVLLVSCFVVLLYKGSFVERRSAQTCVVITYFDTSTHFLEILPVKVTFSLIIRKKKILLIVWFSKELLEKINYLTTEFAT